MESHHMYEVRFHGEYLGRFVQQFSEPAVPKGNLREKGYEFMLVMEKTSDGRYRPTQLLAP
jgi:hypothetical protein